MVTEPDPYEGREQSRVKHEILRQYLGSFAHIIGSKWQSITYIDGFSGPWNAQTDDLSDTSFSIALNELRRARATHEKLGNSLGIRCVFVEKNQIAYQRLKAFAETIKDAEILTIYGEFEHAIPEIIRFTRQVRDTFSFTLIDPTGSSGFGMKIIAPLLRVKPGEVLINFMLEFIRRYIEQQGLRKGLEELFGTSGFDENLANLSGIDRDDAITAKYCEGLCRFCDFQYVLRASILHPDKDRLNFQLIYGTRHPKGVKVFKTVEKKVMSVQEKSRARVEASLKKRRSGGQSSFLDPDDMPESLFYSSLRNRYLAQARDAVRSQLNRESRLAYDSVWLAVIRFPLVWESDLQSWLEEWMELGAIEWLGKKQRERTFKLKSGHFILRKADRVK